MGVFGQIGPLFDIAAWAKWLVANWTNVTSYIVGYLFGFLSDDYRVIAEVVGFPVMFFLVLCLSSRFAKPNAIGPEQDRIYSSRILLYLLVFFVLVLVSLDIVRTFSLYLFSSLAHTSGESSTEIYNTLLTRFFLFIIAYVIVITSIIRWVGGSRSVLSRRLVFVLLGVFILIVLSTLSTYEDLIVKYLRPPS